MKKYILIFIALFLLVADFRIGVCAYPAYEEFSSEAPNTVEMVTGHVIGDEMMIDVLSDALGFILLIVSSIIFMKYAGKNNNITPATSEKTVKSMKKVLGWSIAGFILYVVEKIMPFYLNGNYRFRAEYALYFLLTIAEIVAIGYSVMSVCRLLETVDNHSYNNITTIFAMISVGCLAIAKVLYFYDLTILFIIYYAISIVLFLFASYRLKKYN